uniref:Zinc finger PHD-type domain-containing protein n=1 Tax=Bactrocera tryoni TaxID=59916 RepID=A0A142LX50_BACRY|nr:hypothetical protein [Bactrocera tryoni]
MPCVCGHRVDRAQPKISCHKCNQIFHLSCVNLSQADVDFLVKSKNAFYCKACAVVRRNSIRSPPASPSVRKAQCTYNLSSQQQNAEQSNSEIAEPLLEHNKHNKENVVLNSLVLEVSSLRSEQTKALALIQQLCDDRKSLIAMLNELKSEICTVHKKLSDNVNFSAANPTLTAATAVVTSDSTIAAPSNTTVPADNVCENYLAPATPKALSAASTTANSIFTSTTIAGTNAPSPNVVVSAPIDSVSMDYLAPATSKALSAAPSAACSTRSIAADNNNANTYADAVGRNINTHSKANNNPTVAAKPVRPPVAVNAAQSVAVDDSVNLNSSTSITANRNLKLKVSTRNKKSPATSTVVGVNANVDLDVVIPKKWIHLSAFKSSVTEEDIISFVVKHANVDREHLLCYKLIKKDTDINNLKRINFKLGVSPSFFNAVFSSSVWPSGIKLRPFKFFPKGGENSAAD